MVFPFTPTAFSCLRVTQGCNKLDEFGKNEGKWVEGWEMKNGREDRVWEMGVSSWKKGIRKRGRGVSGVLKNRGEGDCFIKKWCVSFFPP